jgi:preprotein translocase SecE subunit
MFKFFSESKQELEHVVWPTPAETKKYMMYTVGVIVVMAILLAVVGYGLQTSLSALRTTLGMGQDIVSTSSGDTLATEADLQDILGDITVSGEGTEGVNVNPTPAQ